MRALSISQPYAELILRGLKRIEFGSTWLTAGGFDHLDKLGAGPFDRLDKLGIGKLRAGRAHRRQVRPCSPRADRGRGGSVVHFAAVGDDQDEYLSCMVVNAIEDAPVADALSHAAG
jgi:hypothetical protein